MHSLYLRLLLPLVLCALVFKATGQQTQTVQYSASTEDFANPERGFMQFTETSSSNYTQLDPLGVAFWRTLNQPFGADYAIYSTLGYRGFYMEDFVNGPISNDYLNAMQLDFDAARQGGVKLVLRFAYTRNTSPPYGDAPKSVVLQHIAQLKPIFQANADVIAVLNMGFIGAWGEGYYTDHFGDDSQPPYGLTAQNWNDRTEVLEALLDALPADRSVMVRVPQMKQKAVYGADAPTDAAPLTLSEAWQNTPKARIGFFNDCFLSSADDLGTYKNYDTGQSGPDTAAFKPYYAQDSRFVPVGGETCINWDPYSDCVEQPGGGAQAEMARMHTSYLNAGWNNAVNNEWVSGGCMEEIKQRLGYRFELQSGEYPGMVRHGQVFSVKIALQNKGFAAPFNPRKVRLLLRETSTQHIWPVELPDNPRSWLPGDQLHTIEHHLCLPSDLPTGQYELLLHLADPYPSLTNRPEYAIRLANENTWEEATGFNRLLHQVEVLEATNNPIIQPPGPISLTFGDSVTLDAGAGFAAWVWSTGETTQQIFVSACGEYAVEVLDEYGCRSNSVPVELQVAPLVSFANGVLQASDSGLYQWLLDGAPISGANEQTFVPTVSGNYTVEVDCNGIWLSSNAISVVIVGVHDPRLAGLKFYPNPVPSHVRAINLDLQGMDSKPVTIVLTDTLGRERVRTTVPGNAHTGTLDVSTFSAGTYFVQIWQEGKLWGGGLVLKM